MSEENKEKASEDGKVDELEEMMAQLKLSG